MKRSIGTSLQRLPYRKSGPLSTELAYCQQFLSVSQQSEAIPLMTPAALLLFGEKVVHLRGVLGTQGDT